MQEDIEQKVKIVYDTNAEKASKDVAKLDNSVEKTTKSQKDSKKATDSQKGSLEDLGGGLGRAITGFKGLIKQAWALVANPVGAIITAIALSLMVLFKAFTSTKGGAEKFDQIMAGIGATIDVVRDRVLKVADALVKFLSGDFSGAMADAKSAVSGFGAEVAREFQIAADAKKSLQEVADTMRELGVQRAKLNRDLVEAKEIIESETATYKEKKEAIDSVKKAEEEQTTQELANAQKKLDAIIAQNAQSDSSAEDLQAQADAETALFNIQQKSAEDRIKNIKLTKKADNEEESRLKAISTARKAAAAERAKLAEEEKKEAEKIANLKLSEEQKVSRAIQDLEDKTEEEKLARKKERDLEAIEQLKQQGVDVRNLLIYNDELYNNLEDELREKRKEEKAERDEAARQKELEAQKKQAEEEKKIEDAKLAQKIAIQEAEDGLISGALNFAKMAFAKNKGIQKGILIAENAAALAKITMNTVEAVSKSNAASPLTFGMPWSGIHIAQGALGAANVIASTARGLKELGGGSAGSSPNMGGARGGASASPQVGFQASSENQVATTIAQNTNEQAPVEAFVVESQITTAQAAVRKRLENNSF
tara:strand:+ start:5791 stop:7578 length:1788 start_codon:yes stop_codon:yes gene_type:complete